MKVWVPGGGGGGTQRRLLTHLWVVARGGSRKLL